MTLYRVSLRRTETATVWVEANDAVDAAEAAEELAYGLDWLSLDESEADDVEPVESVPRGERYWTGGEDGRWVRA